MGEAIACGIGQAGRVSSGSSRRRHVRYREVSMSREAKSEEKAISRRKALSIWATSCPRC